MQGYYIEVGYMSGAGRKSTNEEDWQELKQIAESTWAEPDMIVAEALAFNAPAFTESGTLREFLEGYRKGAFNISEANRDNVYIALHASGGGEARAIKEHLCRAFCRLVMRAAHQRGLEVSIQVS